MKKVLCFLVFFYGFKVCAHNPNEIGYDFQINKERQELIIHFTPKSAIDLIQYLKLDLKEQRIIKLEDYLDDFESYFQNSTEIYLSHRKVGLKLLDGNLYAHDAKLQFVLENVPVDFTGFDITINSYSEIYKRLKNIVSVSLEERIYKQQLDGYTKKFRVNSIEGINKAGATVFHNLISLGVLFMFAFIIFRFRRD